MASKPAVLIFGGLNTCSRALAAFLVPLQGDPLVSFLRIVDKFSVQPPTTYIGSEFTKVLEKPEVEYRQANLTNPAAVASAYDVPEGNPSFDYVFDFAGEVRPDRTEFFQITNTLSVTRLLGLEAAKRNIKSYIRIQHPFYETSSKQPATEKDDIKPTNTIGIWWHETLRTLAAIENLNLVILRVGFVYGPYTNFGEIATLATVSGVYGYLQRPFKSMWSPGKNPTHTIHVEDTAAAAWACANWMASRCREEANQLAGEVIPFHNEKSKVKEIDGMVPHDQMIIAPLFNLVDDSNSTLASTGSTITSVFGTTFEFFNLVESTLFKILEDLDYVNEQHVESWTEMLVNSSRPISNSPLNPYMDKHTVAKRVFALDNNKIKKIVGYKLLRPEFSAANLQEIVDKWKADGVWPDVTKSTNT